MELRHRSEKPFLASMWTPPPATFTLLCMWGGMRCLCGVWAWRQTGKGAKRKRQCPGYTLPPLHEHKTPSSSSSSYPLPSISYRPDKFMASCIWVWQQQPSRVWRAQQQRSADTRCGFSFFAVDLGLALHTHAEGPCQCKMLRVRSFYQEGIIFAAETHTFSCEMPRRASSGGFAVALPELQSLESAHDAGPWKWRLSCHTGRWYGGQLALVLPFILHINT